MTARRAAREHEEPPAGPARDDDPPPGPSPRAGTVAPQPRPLPAAEPAEPGPAPSSGGPPSGPSGPPSGPSATSGLSTTSGPSAASGAAGSAVVPGQATGGPDRPVEVEPTTGAPVGAVPRRVPVRQPGGRFRPGTTAGGPPESDDDGLFWAPIEEVHWDGTPLREEHGRPGRWRRGDTGRAVVARARRQRADRPARPPDPWRGLSALLALSLLAAFFAWVSAGPFWLSVGHRVTGTVVVGECTGGGLTQRCRGVFTADDGGFVAFGVRISGVPAERSTTGSALPAGMTGPAADTAYADTRAGLHLRWLLGLLLVLACGGAIARCTGATLLTDRRARRWATAAAVAGPLVITAGLLAAAW
ncbi:hypothetical protein [Micromonospora sp. MW-13]|uniref:hypothetical protein n=1 Tax=Micromonospora sp. MW-13 TaxID=2094022 RepID=UPI001FB41E57|nr:hypothetical protein [Micromonospora sp. MW-13]